MPKKPHQRFALPRTTPLSSVMEVWVVSMRLPSACVAMIDFKWDARGLG